MHLDGLANDFLPDSGRWQWRYWGEGHFTPMQARWDVKGSGEWRDNAITLSSLSTGFDKLEYGTMRVSTPRLTLEQPIRWLRDAEPVSYTHLDVYKRQPLHCAKEWTRETATRPVII